VGVEKGVGIEGSDEEEEEEEVEDPKAEAKEEA